MGSPTLYLRKGHLKNALFAIKWPYLLRDRSLITSRGGGRWFGRGGTILKQALFWGVHFSLVKNMRGVKFYDGYDNI